MTRMKKLVATIILTICAWPLLSMETPNNALIPQDIWVLIFTQLEPDAMEQVSQTCSSWRQFADKVWPIWFCEKFPVKYALLRKQNTEQMKKIFKKYYKAQIVAESLLNMKSWSNEKKDDLISMESQTIQDLLTYLEISLLENTGDLIKEPKHIVCFFLAHMVINLSAAHEAAFKGSALTLRNFNIFGAAYNDATNIVAKAHSQFDPSGFVNFFAAADNTATEDISKALVDALDQFNPMDTLDNLNPEKQRYQLGIAFALAYVAQPNFIAKHFIRAYQNASIYVDNNPNFSHSELLKIAKSYNRLEKNPFIVCMMATLTDLEDKVQLIVQIN